MRLALVGCGAAAEYCHVPAIHRVLGAEAFWLVDPDRRRARALARRRDRVAEGHDEVLGEVDAAVVAVPNDLHAPVAGALLRAGVHVLCEKPLGRTPGEARAIADAATEGGAVLAVGHFRRFFSSLRTAGDVLARGGLGRPRSFAAEEGFVYAWDARSPYSLDRGRAGGGVLLDLGTHVLDQLGALLGALDVRRYRDDAHGGVEADCVVELAAGDVEGTLELSRTRALGSKVVVESERGTLALPLAVDGPVEVNRTGAPAERLGAEQADFGVPAAFEAQLRDFLRAAGGIGAPAVTPNDALATAELVEACYARRLPLAEPWVRETLRDSIAPR
jgi:predicted dehydrogenase